MYTREEVKQLLEQAIALAMFHHDENTWDALLEAQTNLLDFLG